MHIEQQQKICFNCGAISIRDDGTHCTYIYSRFQNRKLGQTRALSSSNGLRC